MLIKNCPFVTLVLFIDNHSFIVSGKQHKAASQAEKTMNATMNIHNLLLITFLLLSKFSCCCSQLQCQQCVAQRYSNHHQLCFSSVCQKCLIAILISCRWKLEKWRDTSCILFCGFSKCCLVKVPLEYEVLN